MRCVKYFLKGEKMLKLLRWFLVIFGGIYMVGCNQVTAKQDNAQVQCTLEYHFSNPSLGPVNGVQDLTIIMRDGQFVSATDKATNGSIELKKIKGLSYLQKALKQQKTDVLIKYNKDKMPVLIKKSGNKHKLGAGFTVNIVYHNCN
jgi:hypothetical protein